jgi:RecA-family ATPase
MSNQDTALSLARAGLAVFPCDQNKKPLVAAWRENSTSDEAVVQQWWVSQRGALPAIDCGKSGLVVIDCDRHKDQPDGVKAFNALCKKHGQSFDNLLIVKTPSGGRHFYFQQPNGKAFGNGRGKLPPGIDVRGDGGYVIAIGAELANGKKYESSKTVTDIKERLPAWCTKILRPVEKTEPSAPKAEHNPGSEREEAYAAAALDNIADEFAAAAPGARNDQLNKAAYRLGTMCGRGWIDRGKVEAKLADAAAACGLAKDDGRRAVEKTIASGLDAGMKSPHSDLDDGPKQDNSGKAEDDKPPRPPLTFIDLKAWEGQPVPERQWVVRDRIPDCEVTLLSGEGAIGKSMILKQLAVATVSAKDWLCALPEPGPVIYVTAEEKEDELHFRLHEIAVRHYGTRFVDLGDLHIASLKGEDTVLAYPDRANIIRPTELFDRVFEAAQAIKPKWIDLDPAANLFAGNENDRSHVQQYIGLLTRIAVQCSTAVVLVSHPSLTGINTGSGLSGSTAWHNSVRSRLYLRKATTAAGDEPDPDLRQLEVMKANYGPVGETINLRWKNGLFLPVASMGNLEKLAAEQKADTIFLALLKLFAEQGQDVNHTSGHIYAPAKFAKHPQAQNITSAAFARAMQRLLDSKKIKIEQTGKSSRPSRRLIINQPEV